MIDLIGLQNKIHKQNRDMGWWDKPRQFSTMICLLHSELSEAMEGDRKNLMDDHLPEYPMFQVELADFVIRCLDYLGSVNVTPNDWGTPYTQDYPECKTLLLAHLHGNVSSAFFSSLEDDRIEIESQLMDAVLVSFNYSRRRFNLLKIINDKVEYNRTRADHKRENRAKEGGKKY